MDHKLASRVTVDYPTGELWIDETAFPYLISPGVEIEGDASRGEVCVVWVGILALDAGIVNHLEGDLGWLADLANQHRAELGLPPVEVPA